MAERTIRTLKEYLRVHCNAHRDDWPELLPLFVATVNMAQPERLCGATPMQLAFGVTRDVPFALAEGTAGD